MSKSYEKKSQIINKRKKQMDSIKQLIAKENYPKARSELLHYLEENHNDMFGHFLHARILVKINDLEGAKQSFQKVAASESNNRYSALVGLGDIAKAQGKINEARSYYKQAIENSPNKEFNAIFCLANLEREEKNYDEALNILDLLGKNDNQVKIEKVKIYIEQQRRAAAAEVLATIIPKSRKQKRQLALENGRLARICGEYAKAELHYLEAKETEEKDQTYYNALYEEAKLAMNLEKYGIVIDNCEELYASQQTFNGDINLMLGNAKKAQKKYHSAIENYRLSVNSTDDDIHYESSYCLGVLEFMLGNLNQAENALKESVKNPKLSQSEVYSRLIGAYSRLISTLIRKNKYQEAQKYLKEIQTTLPGIINDADFSVANIIISKNIGKSISKSHARTYIEKQAIKYREKEALYHIKDRHQSKDRTEGNFSKTIHIDTLFETIKLEMTEDNRVNEGIIDIYEIDYPNIGYDLNNNLVHKIRVIALPGTKDIITMYPGTRNTPRQGDLKKTIQSAQKSKANDQISKFYQRYNKKGN